MNKAIDKIIRVKKSELPLPLVVEADDGELRVLELAPASERKLGAFIRDAGSALRAAVLRMFRSR